MSIDITSLDTVVTVGVPFITGVAGFLISEIKNKRERLSNWTAHRITEIAEQREDIHSVMFIGDGPRASIEATIDYRFRKLFESVHKCPLRRRIAKDYEILIKALFAKNGFDRRGLSPDTQADLSADVNQICVELELLLERAGSKVGIF